MTNRDELNNMTNEELSEFIATSFIKCAYCVYKNDSCELLKCTDGITEWLESEMEE